MKNRVLSTFTLIFNIALVALVTLSVVSFYVPIFGVVKETPISLYLYFTTLSNLFVGAVALLEIPFLLNSISKRRYLVPMWLRAVKLAAVACVTVTMVTALTWLSQALGFALMIEGVNLFLHVITPAVAIVSYCFFDAQNRFKFRHTFYVLVPMIAYMVFYFLTVFAITLGDKDWYRVAYDYVDGVRSENINVLKSVLSIVAFLVGPVLIAIVLWLINQLFYKAYFVRKPLPRPEDTRTPEGKKVVIIEENKKPVEEPVSEPVVEEPIQEEEVAEEEPEEVAPAIEEPVEEVEEEEAEEEKPAEKKSPAKAAKKPAEKKASEKNPAEKKEAKKPLKKAAAPVAPSEFGKYEGKTRVYHISQSKTVDGQWQVKLAGGDKAVKLFKTQKEAIEFAKGLVRTQGGSIRIHSMKGKMRK